MQPDELRRLLNEGIEAAKAQDRPLARERLLRVLESDDQNEAAWLWLSAALDAPTDQLMALEQVLAINPRHPQALAGARTLRQQLNPAPTAAPVVAEPPISSVTEAENSGGADVAIAARHELAAKPSPAQPEQEVARPAEPAATIIETLPAEDDPYQC